MAAAVQMIDVEAHVAVVFGQVPHVVGRDPLLRGEAFNIFAIDFVFIRKLFSIQCHFGDIYSALPLFLLLTTAALRHG